MKNVIRDLRTEETYAVGALEPNGLDDSICYFFDADFFVLANCVGRGLMSGPINNKVKQFERKVNTKRIEK
jgi:hypothetical protein